MIKKRVRIVQCRSDIVYVEPLRPNCSTCSGACPAAMFSGWFAKDHRYAVAVDRAVLPEGHRIGREIYLVADAEQLLGAAFRHYGFPVAALLLGVSFAAAVDLTGFWHDTVSAVVGLGAFLLCQWYLCRAAPPSLRYGLVASGNLERKK